ncbi:MAG: hypothetical protein ACOC1F_05520 [Myxococcota bacterium]
MKLRAFACLPLLVALAAAPAQAAQVVQADAVVHTSRVQPTHQLAETLRIHVPYGNTPNTLGFRPAATERVAVGPAAFDVNAHGLVFVADPVRGKVFRFDPSQRQPALTAVAPLPLPFADIALDRDGNLHTADVKTRSVTLVANSRRDVIPGSSHTMRFLRDGQDLVLRTGDARYLVRNGSATARAARLDVEKCNAEAGLVTFGAKRVQLEIGAPLASIRLIGATNSGDVYLVVERFRKRGRLEVDREVVVLDARGRLKAKRDVVGVPVVHATRDFALSPRGELYRMVPGTDGVTFVRWAVR